MNIERKATEASLRQIFKAMDPNQAQEIREAYYKAIEGLLTLSEALEVADSQQPVTAGPLLAEHLIATQSLNALKRSLLGAVL